MGSEASVKQVHPRKLIEALFAASGAELVAARATGFLRRGEGGRVSGVTTDGGREVCGDVVLLAAGAWSSRLAGWFEQPPAMMLAE